MLTHVILTEDILNLNLSIQEKFLIALSKMPQGCFLSNSQIASYLVLSKSRVSHLITKLSREGYIDVKIERKPSSKEIAKRTFTFKQAIKKVQEIAKRTISKAKEVKGEYVSVSQKVGTQTVQQVAFGSNFYKKTKQNKFTTTYSHNWDIDELERLEMKRLEEQYE